MTEGKMKGLVGFEEEPCARKLPVCDYGDGSVTWANCLPCPLYKDGNCLSRGAAAYRAVHENQQEEETDEVVKAEMKKPQEETILEPPQIPIEKWIEHHRKRGVVLHGPDGRVIDWLWCLSTWDKLGRLIIYAAPGDPFYDLSLFFDPEKLSPQKLQGITAWLEKHSNERADSQSLAGRIS